MAIEDMDRKMAVRVFGLRAKRLGAQIRELPPAERFRLVADFIERGHPKLALQVARFALSELEKETPT